MLDTSALLSYVDCPLRDKKLIQSSLLSSSQEKGQVASEGQHPKIDALQLCRSPPAREQNRVHSTFEALCEDPPRSFHFSRAAVFFRPLCPSPPETLLSPPSLSMLSKGTAFFSDVLARPRVEGRKKKTRRDLMPKAVRRDGEIQPFSPLSPMSGLQSQGVNVPTGQQIRFKKSGVKVAPNPNTAALRPQEPGLLKDHNLRFAFARWNPTMLTAFRLILLIRFCAAMYTAISDCDEGEAPSRSLSLALSGRVLTSQSRVVFNYWDPLHYLVHGKGFQTWEYSPEFSIRSYFYLLIHAGPSYTLKLLGFEDKVSLCPSVPRPGHSRD